MAVLTLFPYLSTFKLESQAGFWTTKVADMEGP